MEESRTAQSKFLTSLRKLSEAHGFSWSQVRILVALSGGLDSVCMLRMLNACKEQLKFTIKTIHFNHGVRGAASDLDEHFCVNLCGRLGLELQVVNLKMSKESSNFQALARERRKQYYDDWRDFGPYHLVATAHHADDFIESFFIGVHQGRLDERLIPLKSVDLDSQFLRPLVYFDKNELRDLAQNSDWEWREDGSNSDSNYLRNFYRNKLLTNSALVQSVSNFTNYLVCLDNDLKEWLQIQLEKFYARDSILDRYECEHWEDSRFRDFWLIVLQRDYPECLRGFDAKRIKQVRVGKYRGHRVFQIGVSQSLSKKKLLLVETSRGYHLELE